MAFEILTLRYYTDPSENKSIVGLLLRVLTSGAVGGKTGKTSVLPGFSKIERGGGSGGGAPHWWSYLALSARRAGGASVPYHKHLTKVHTI